MTSINTWSQNLASDLQDIFDANQLMGMSVVVTIDGITEQYHYGLRDFDRNLPITQDTYYRIASISKAFTALGLVKLIGQGLVNLDDDISTALGYTVRNPNFPNTPITYRMVLSHQSGLQDGTGYNSFLSATYSQNPIPNISEVLLPAGAYYTSNMWRSETPGTYFAYSNINFGLIGTLIEALSNERFDVYMKEEILDELSIDGSYNIQDIPNINDVAVLYRNNGGWQPQFDNYQGVMPSPPDLSGYTPGTNGAYFSPQGGLRCSAAEVNNFLSYLNEPSQLPLTIAEAALDEMKAIQWDYNGSNGDNYFGLFNRWGLGLQHANVTQGDQICNLGTYGSFLGHVGEAYGLISDAFYSEQENVQAVIIINGAFNGYEFGQNSSFYQVEESIYEVLCDTFESTLGAPEAAITPLRLSPNPFTETITVNSAAEIYSIEIFSIEGKRVFNEINSISETINLSHLDASVYFAVITTSDGVFRKKISKK